MRISLLISAALFTLSFFSTYAQAQLAAMPIQQTSLNLINLYWGIQDVSALTSSLGCFPSNDKVGISTEPDIRNYMYVEHFEGQIKPGETVEAQFKVCEDRATSSNVLGLILTPTNSTRSMMGKQVKVEFVNEFGDVRDVTIYSQWFSAYTRHAGTYRIRIKNLSKIKPANFLDVHFSYASYK